MLVQMKRFVAGSAEETESAVPSSPGFTHRADPGEEAMEAKIFFQLLRLSRAAEQGELLDALAASEQLKAEINAFQATLLDRLAAEDSGDRISGVYPTFCITRPTTEAG
jgi:hypothetical protein